MKKLLPIRLQWLPWLLASCLSLLLLVPQQSQAQLYYVLNDGALATTADQLRRVNLDGSTNILIKDNFIQSPGTTVLDAANNRVLVANIGVTNADNPDRTRIIAVGLGTGNPVSTLVTAGLLPGATTTQITGMALDAVNGYLYYVLNDGALATMADQLRRVNLDGSNNILIKDNFIQSPGNIVLDAANNRVLVANIGVTNAANPDRTRIVAVGLGTGNPVSTLVTAGLLPGATTTQITGMALDAANGYLYYVLNDGALATMADQLRRVNLDGSNNILIKDNFIQSPGTTVLDAANNRVLVANIGVTNADNPDRTRIIAVGLGTGNPVSTLVTAGLLAGATTTQITGLAIVNQTSPTVTTTSPASNITSSNATVSGSITSDGGSALTDYGVVFVAGNGSPTTSNTKVQVGTSSPAAFPSNFSANLTGLTPSATYTARAYATNGVGTSYGSAVSFTTSQPTPTVAPMLLAPANGSSQNPIRPTYTGTAPASSTVTVYVDGARIGSATATGGGGFSFLQPTNLTEGTHSVYATAQSSGQLTSPGSNTNTFAVDATPPTVMVAGPASNTTSSSPFSVTITFSEPVTDFISADVAFTITNFNSATLTALSSTAYRLNIAPRNAGPVSFSVPASSGFDAAGNGNTAAGPFIVSYIPNQAPTDVNLSGTAVAENAAVGTLVGTLSTTDADIPAQDFTYSLVSGAGSDNNALFTISGNNLLTAAAFDFETKSTYSIRVRSTDSGTPALSYDKVLTISVTNVNELTASITSQTNVICFGGATGAATVTASGENGPFSYDWLPGNPAGDGTPTVTGLAAGSYSVVVTATSSGFSTTALVSITQNAALVVSVSPATSAVCGGTVSLSAVTTATNPSFSWSGGSPTTGPVVTVSNTGAYSVTLTDGNGCTATGSASVTINPVPGSPTVVASVSACQNTTPVSLSTAVISGSNLRWYTLATGGAASTLAPVLPTSSIGSRTFYVSQVNANGCESDRTAITLTITPLPTVSISGLATAYCKNTDPVTLTGLPAGGAFTVDGVAATQVDPAFLTVGSHTVAYSFTNSSGCVGTTTQSVTINALPTVTITGLAAAYCKSAAAVTLGGNPAGGRFTVNGTPATQFAPATLVVGTYTVVYSVTSGDGCGNTATQSVRVDPLPVVSIIGLGAAYCKDASPVSLTGSPAGGSFTIDGTAATSFNPSLLAVGNRTVDFTYTDGNGCTNTATQVVTVKATPPAPTLLTQSGGSYLASQSAVTVDLNSGNVNLVVGGCGGTIAWSGPNNSSGNGSLISVSTNQPGTFTYQASCTVDGCTSPLATAVVRVGGRLTVLHRDVDNYVNNNAIQPLLVLQNQGAGALPLSGLTLRYYLTVEGASALSNLSINYAQVGNQNVRLRYVPLNPAQTGAAGYVEYSFTAGAGSLAPGASSGPIQAYFAKGDYSGLNEADDYSYATVRDQLVGNLQITAYFNGVLIAGQEPGGVFTPIKALRALTESKNGPSATQINTYLTIRNEGNVAVNFSDLNARYYFTSDGTERLQVEVDEGQVSTRLVALSPAVGGANYYLEIRYNQGGQLAPGASTGRVRYRISKPDGGRFNQANDYSYQEQPAESSSNNRVVVFVGQDRVWGNEPTGSARMASAEPMPELEVTVLGNPVRGDVVSVQIKGAGSEPLQLQLVSAQGRVITQRQVASPQAVEQHELSVAGQGPGVLLLQVSTPTRSRTSRVLKVE
ncbi:cellulose binding domain-containing protein [Fibrella arboris]|uniref:cellulose binding domain-containing protein n=1 Tax=Fibrella arboris TaxID=3242486 RepID=UPI003521F163